MINSIEPFESLTKQYNGRVLMYRRVLLLDYLMPVVGIHEQHGRTGQNDGETGRKRGKRSTTSDVISIGGQVVLRLRGKVKGREVKLLELFLMASSSSADKSNNSGTKQEHRIL
jgi:hypothetical protein